MCVCVCVHVSLTILVMILICIYRELKHGNVCRFYGCILDGPVSALLYEFCERGSLEDILNSSSHIDLDWVFRLSFALDAAEGMAFLHSKKLIHGRLSARSCAIDMEWKLKIQGIFLLALKQAKAKLYTYAWSSVLFRLQPGFSADRA